MISEKYLWNYGHVNKNYLHKKKTERTYLKDERLEDVWRY